MNNEPITPMACWLCKEVGSCALDASNMGRGLVVSNNVTRLICQGTDLGILAKIPNFQVQMNRPHTKTKDMFNGSQPIPDHNPTLATYTNLFPIYSVNV